MKILKLTTIALLSSGLLPLMANPTLIPVALSDLTTEAQIKPNLNSTGTNFLASDHISLYFNLHIAEADIGFQSELYLFAKASGKSFIRDANNNWQPWVNEPVLIATRQLTLQANEHLEVLQNNNLPAGEYQVFAAYKTRSEEVKYNGEPSTFVVFNDRSPTLHPVLDPEVLRDYLYKGATYLPQNVYYDLDFCCVTPDLTSQVSESSISFSGTDIAVAPAANKTSGTTLQEQNVDESDRIKTDGHLLFSLRSCENEVEQSCLYSYQLQESPALATALTSLQVSHKEETQAFYSNKRLGELYLNKASDKNDRALIWLQSAHLEKVNTNSTYPNWSTSNQQIQLKFIDASQPEKLTQTDQLTIDGQLLSSRIVDGVMYLLSRYSTQHYQPYNAGTPYARPENPNNTETLENPTPQYIKPPLNFFLPHYKVANNPNKLPLVSSENCYLAPQNNARYNQATLSIITAIPINNPSALQSRCIAGALDTFYASPNALYFATSRYPYAINGNQFTYNEEQVTDIHKFALQSANIDYRGSGQVSGHLGWEEDKKSFRFGEHNHILRVATSEGSTWGMDSRTKVTVLEEDSDNHLLKEIGSINNLGKPGEKLYAARFIGNKGYLVTFRTTDPLIVLDFSQPSQPTILGELEIDGYSDYLQPIGDNYLLGIGKDAIADENAGGDFRGAWYQGVKLSLFDVSSTENLREIQSIILGKRGTTSTVLQDHHGLALLETEDNNYTVTLPIELHDSLPKPYWGYNDNPLSLHYNWTHTGLYVFNINTENTPTLTLNGKLITESSLSFDQKLAHSYDFTNDRSVIQNNTVHYIHSNQVVSAQINQLK